MLYEKEIGCLSQLKFLVIYCFDSRLKQYFLLAEMKRLTHEKIKHMEESSKKEYPDMEKYKAALEKGQANLEKYKKLAIMTQNVLRVNFRKDSRYSL